jgi:hypothetical protein
MIKVFVFGLIVKIINYVKRVTRFHIEDVKLDYTFEELPDEFWEPDSPLWNDESRYWTHDQTSHHTVNVTKLYKSGKLTVPGHLKDPKLSIKYLYNGKTYKYITSDITGHKWPPSRNTSDLKFSIPIAKVWLIDDAGVPIRDVTSKYMRYAGPFGDFWGEMTKLKPYDLFDTSEFFKLKIRDVLNTERYIDYSSTLVAR